VIWGAAAYAIHLYQNSQGSQITHNVIVGNGYGVIFAGSPTLASDNNTVTDNIIAGSTAGYDVSSYWGGTVGTGNTLKGNCISAGVGGAVLTPAAGFAASGNVTAATPGFVDAATNNYRLSTGSPCLSVVGYDTVQAVATGTTTTPPPTTTTPPPTTTTPPPTTTTPPPTTTTPPPTTTTPPPTTTTPPPTTTTPPPAPAPAAPSATSVKASAVSSLSATLNGVVAANGHVTGWYFVYGKSTGYGRSTPKRTVAAGFNAPVQYRLSGLAAGTTYHFRLVVTWSNGTVLRSADERFTEPGAVAVSAQSHKALARIATACSAHGAKRTPAKAPRSCRSVRRTVAGAHRA
jgi:hypothetical protein